MVKWRRRCGAHTTPSERQLTSTWCAPEIHLALEKGYEILRVHEVYQYPRTMQFDEKTGKDGVMSAYVRCFMAYKSMRAGGPTTVIHLKKKEQLVKDTLKYDGIGIDPAKNGEKSWSAYACKINLQ